MKLILPLLLLFAAACGDDDKDTVPRIPVSIAVDTGSEEYLAGKAIYLTNPDTDDDLIRRFIIAENFHGDYQYEEVPFCEEGSSFRIEVREAPSITGSGELSNRIFLTERFFCNDQSGGLKVLIYTPRSYPADDPRNWDSFYAKIFTNYANHKVFY